MDKLNEYSDHAIKLGMEYAPKLALAILTLIVGLIVIGMIVKGIRNMMEKRDLDPGLRSFVVSLSSIGLKIMLGITILGMVGIEMTSFIAVLGAAGLAVGLALSGTLQNFAGGVMILVFKPFKAGDYIDAQGHSGTVSEIQIFNTILKTPDNKTIIIPNGGLSTGSMVNYSTEPKRRVDFTFGIGYEDDIDKAKAVLRRLADADERVHQDPEPFVVLSELGDSSVNFIVRLWVDAPDYWAVKFDMTEKVKKTFDAEGLSFPFPQRDVHMFQEK